MAHPRFRSLGIALAGLAAVAQSSVAETLIQGGPFIPDAKIYGEGDARYEEWQVDGLRYRFNYLDGKGRFSGAPGEGVDVFDKADSQWLTICGKDPMTDAVFCLATRGNMFVTKKKGGSWEVTVGLKHFPGSQVGIRLGDKPPMLSTDTKQFTEAQSRQVIDALMAGTEIRTRYSKWPEKGPIDVTFTPDGFKQVRQFLDWAVAHIP